MIEQYVYNLISQDATLQTLLNAGSDDLHLYPNVIPRGIIFNNAITFTTISTVDEYPNIKSISVQFNIFAKTHLEISNIAQALYNLFNQDTNHSSGGLNVVFTIRRSESDLGFDFDENLYHREATYYFKIR